MYNFTYQSGSNVVLLSTTEGGFNVNLPVYTSIMESNSYVYVPLSPVTQINIHPCDVNTINNQSKSYWSIVTSTDLYNVLKNNCFNTSFVGVNSSIQPIKTISGSYSVTTDDFTILAVSSGSNINITLPDATTCTGKMFTIKRSGSLATTITAFGSGSQLIDSLNYKTLASPEDAYLFQSTGSKFIVL